MPIVKKVDSPRELREDIIPSNDSILANAQKWHIRPSSTSPNILWKELKEDTFSVIIVDEAHHLPATQWQRIIDKFSKHAKVVFFTATPFRSDGQEITNSIGLVGFAYRLDRRYAIQRNIIRDTTFDSIETPASTDKDENLQILKNVSDLLTEKNTQCPLPGGYRHVAIAIARDKAGADALEKMWNDRHHNKSAAAYHSDLKKGPLADIMKRLKEGKVQLLVIVAMLLEGFDYPPISVAAIATGIKSPVKFAQFIGRAQRVVRIPEKEEQGGIANIVTHEHYQQLENYQVFELELLIPDKDETEDQVAMVSDN